MRDSIPYKNKAPIVLFAYNRPAHTKQAVEALQKNELASESELIVFSDGPKNEDVRSRVEEVRQYLKTITGFKDVRIYEREHNYGLANTIIDGVTTIVNEFGKVIVLEDDLITSPHFLRYMNDALTYYEKEECVVSVHGYCYPIKKQLPETFLIKGADCWGWATWKRGWEIFESDGELLLNKIEEQNKKNEFDFNNSYAYTEMLRDQIAGKNDSWAIRWYASAFLKNKLTLYPGRSLVSNIGTDGSGTHGGIAYSYEDILTNSAIKVTEIEVTENTVARKTFEKYLKSQKDSFYRRQKRKIKSILCR